MPGEKPLRSGPGPSAAAEEFPARVLTANSVSSSEVSLQICCFYCRMNTRTHTHVHAKVALKCGEGQLPVNLAYLLSSAIHFSNEVRKARGFRASVETADWNSAAFFFFFLPTIRKIRPLTRRRNRSETEYRSREDLHAEKCEPRTERFKKERKKKKERSIVHMAATSLKKSTVMHGAFFDWFSFLSLLLFLSKHCA